MKSKHNIQKKPRKPGSGAPRNNLNHLRHGLASQPFRLMVAELRARAKEMLERQDSKVNPLSFPDLAAQVAADVRELQSLRVTLSEILTQLDERGDLDDRALAEFERRILDIARVLARFRSVQSSLATAARALPANLSPDALSLDELRKAAIEELVADPAARAELIEALEATNTGNSPANRGESPQGVTP